MDTWDKSNGSRKRSIWLCQVHTTTLHRVNNVTFKRTIKDKCERLTRSNRNSFCHIPSEKSYSLHCFGICVQRGREPKGCRKHNNTSRAMRRPPLHNLHHPPLCTTSSHWSHSFSTKCSTNHLRVQTLFTTNAHSADNENATPKKKKKLQGCRNRAELTAFERNISNFWKLSLSPHPLMSEVRKRWACFKLENFVKWRTEPAIQRLVPGSKEGGWPPGSWLHLGKSLHVPAPVGNLGSPFGI